MSYLKIIIIFLRDCSMKAILLILLVFFVYDSVSYWTPDIRWLLSRSN